MMCSGQECWQHGFVPLEKIIMQNLNCLFAGMSIHSAHTFRVTRNAEVRCMPTHYSLTADCMLSTVCGCSHDA